MEVQDSLCCWHVAPYLLGESARLGTGILLPLISLPNRFVSGFDLGPTRTTTTMPSRESGSGGTGGPPADAMLPFLSSDLSASAASAALFLARRASDRTHKHDHAVKEVFRGIRTAGNNASVRRGVRRKSVRPSLHSHRSCPEDIRYES
jgi:hypothetical protein